MRWFKHYSNVRASNKITKLIAKTGLEGYGRYWMLLEHMAFKFDGNDEKFVFSLKDLREILRTYHTNGTLMYLQCMADVGLIFFECEDNVVTISTSILLELQSRDFKKARFDRAETAPKNKTKIKKENKIKNTLDQNEFDRVCDFDLFYKKYPKKVGKTKGLKIFKAQIKSNEQLESLNKALDNYNTFCQKSVTDSKYIKQFDTFMNCWEDWLDNETGSTEFKRFDELDEWAKKKQAEMDAEL